MTVMARLMLIAAAAIAVLPFIAQPFLSAAVSAFASTSVGAFLGSFFAVMLLFSIPVTLLGMASPFAVRLGVRSVEKAGEVAGRMYALSTMGSILGTFLPVALLIPDDRHPPHDARLGRPARPRRHARARPPLLLAPVAIAMIALIPPGTIKPGSGDHLRGRVGSTSSSRCSSSPATSTSCT